MGPAYSSCRRQQALAHARVQCSTCSPAGIVDLHGVCGDALVGSGIDDCRHDAVLVLFRKNKGRPIGGGGQSFLARSTICGY